MVCASISITTLILSMTPMKKVAMTKNTLAVLVSVCAAAIGLSACGSSSSSGGSAKSLTLVAYSTPQAAFEKLIPAFGATPAGKGVSFKQSYGPSGEQSRAVTNGLHADVVDFSLEPDVERLVKAGLVAPDWNQNATHGFVSDSVAVIIVRKGNPKHITGWADLVKPGVQVVTPNPFTSGGARWNVMAAYGAQLKEGKTPAQAQEYLKALFHNVVSQDSSARNALQTFVSGRGDALIDYENEAITDKRKGQPIEYVIPKDTILIQNPIAVVGKGASAATAQKFVDYLISPAAQAIWAAQGYRPVISGVSGASFPKPAGLFTIEAVGGWKKVTKEFFDPETGIVTKIEQGQGVSTAK
ncbi:MAG: sulfate/thiosulfate transport system substrate-binding protein [Solirubrobacteraceae bacterium]|jgi:sulfate/thiosulfate-binding protein|nr:sulfate/thiosulfate transport system substrate-binding protein [Solirubrobacteraceae bacterium]MEA2225924.1 sulfate/thiosulfate transport system substrate-binding protein [Solirubrobacteraceae bacterium]MEA2334149.1 sulfate/thiosulfate transport system substrate-binding protein [Solirubrobacteraceae bacterium]